jgi:ribosomal protein RSM22 (predicted rRNA methylase)
LRDGIERLLQGVPPGALTARATQLSDLYRAGRGSDVGVRDAADVAAYLAARLPATYAAITAALDAAVDRTSDFAPQSLLDFGAGPGTASWAAAQIWPSLRAVTMLDRNAALLAAAKHLAHASSLPSLQTAQVLTSLDPSATYDVVLAGYVFAELSKAEAQQTATRLWNASRGLLVVVEPGTPAGFERIKAIREVLLSLDAHIAAPCAGSYACPIAAPDWCHFSVRLPRSRTHMRAKGADVPFEDEKFSYLAFARDGIALQPIKARILARPHVMKPGIRFKLCTAEGIVDRTVARRDASY